MGSGTSLILVVLVVFYLYLLVRWQCVKREMFVLLGLAGLLLGLIGQFFTLGASTMVVSEILMIIGGIVAFVAAVGACYGGKLPIKVPGMEKEGSKPT
jgi:hypothetical protein